MPLKTLYIAHIDWAQCLVLRTHMCSLSCTLCRWRLYILRTLVSEKRPIDWAQCLVLRTHMCSLSCTLCRWRLYILRTLVSEKRPIDWAQCLVLRTHMCSLSPVPYAAEDSIYCAHWSLKRDQWDSAQCLVFRSHMCSLSSTWCLWKLT